MGHRQRAVETKRGVVDEAEQGTELFAQTAHQCGNLSNLAEVERHKMNLAGFRALGLRARYRQLFILASRYGDHAMARAGKLLRDAKAKAAAAAGHKHTAHLLRLCPGHLAHPRRRKSLPVTATLSADTKLNAAGTL